MYISNQHDILKTAVADVSHKGQTDMSHLLISCVCISVGQNVTANQDLHVVYMQIKHNC